ncbi:MAG: type II toxin-antitoxin system death-on-curing family toxin [Woeseia sp.]|nr:type II toxin-antitoxin system death-on-curing family toxin [Woeseia sp.]NNE62185.1 type II toxin-antitoxin system death-on-curing family toxin [Woeseia sp.]NNL56085.1 type II toxin-antitoxin system death-on-curing family toxin [Woeseia sp.]
MKEPVWLLQSAVLAAHNMMIARFGGADGIRDSGLFDSALDRPANLYHYDNCADLTILAATYASSIIQNHPFVDGNKRTGFIAAYMFLDLNGLTLEADEISATTMTLALAASEIDETEYAEWIDKHTRSTVA